MEQIQDFTPTLNKPTASGQLEPLQDAISTDFEGILDEMRTEIATSQEINTQVNDSLRLSSNALFSVKTGDIASGQESIQSSITILSNILNKHSNARIVNSRFGIAVQSALEVLLLLEFFEHGRLLNINEVTLCTDEEYVGATLGLASEISRYCVTRACENDHTSVLLCRAFLNAVNGKMLEFYFRNGPLRRMYDGLKYAYKRVEDIIFDMSMLCPPAKYVVEKDKLEPETKRARTSGAFDLQLFDSRVFFDSEQLDSVKSRMDAYDLMRETVIKKSRDIQKFSKQAVFSLHGMRKEEAKNKLSKAQEIALEILPIITDYPTLRSGSFSNSLEEWAEARLFLEWVQRQAVLRRSELGEALGQPLTCGEYIGALSDLTGELGRVAVAEASKRNVEAVRSIHVVSLTISRALSDPTVTGKFNQKQKAVVNNTNKVEGLIYELSMVQRGGRRVVEESRDGTSSSKQKVVDDEDDV